MISPSVTGLISAPIALRQAAVLIGSSAGSRPSMVVWLQQLLQTATPDERSIYLQEPLRDPWEFRRISVGGHLLGFPARSLMAWCPNSMSRLIQRQTMDRSWISIAAYEWLVLCLLRMQKQSAPKTNILQNIIIALHSWRIEMALRL